MSDRGARPGAKFEPPPWEKEAFEALAAKRAEQEKAEALLRGAIAIDDLAGSIAAPAATTIEEAGPLAAELLRRGAGADAADDAGGAPDADAAAAGSADASAEGASPPRADQAAADKAAEVLLLRLQHEERDDGHASKWVGRVAAVVTFALGAGMLISGLAMVRTGGGKAVTVIGSGVLSVFGLCFMGMALWVWVSTNRSRGRG